MVKAKFQSVSRDLLAFPSDSIGITLAGGDTLMLTAGDEQKQMAVECIRRAVSRSWGKGIQGETTLKDGQTSIKMKGFPWFDGARAKSIFNHIFEEFGRKGFTFQETVYCGGNGEVMISTLFLRFDPEVAEQYRETSVFCLCIGIRDVRLYDAPMELIETVREIINTVFPRGIKKEGYKNKGKVRTCYKFQLAEYLGTGRMLESRTLVASLLNAMGDAGHRKLCSGGQAMGNNSFFYESRLLGDTSLESSIALVPVNSSHEGMEPTVSEPL